MDFCLANAGCHLDATKPDDAAVAAEALQGLQTSTSAVGPAYRRYFIEGTHLAETSPGDSSVGGWGIFVDMLIDMSSASLRSSSSSSASVVVAET